MTTKCAQNLAIFQVPEAADILVRTIYRYRDKGIFALHEFVVMPDHVHLMLTPSAANSLERVMQFIKGGSSHEIHLAREQKMRIWQEGFHDWTIRDANDWQSKTEYIAMNPVKAGLVSHFRDWPYSSASGRFVLDPMPDKFLTVASGAKARSLAVTPPPGLKPRPPKEQAQTEHGLKSVSPREKATPESSKGQSA